MFRAFKLNPRFRLSRDLEFHVTREGKRFLIATAVLVLAALNTGNNLMYLILAMMLGLGAVAFFVPILNLKGIDVDIVVSEPVFAGQMGRVTLRFKNTKPFPAFSVRLTLDFLKNRSFYLKGTRAKAEAIISEEVLFPVRGIYNIKNLTLNTSFPFIFFVFSRKVPAEKTVIIYPELIELKESPGPESVSSTAASIIRVPTGEYPQGLRRYEEGDPMRHIHWKATAKLATPMVKEFFKERTERFTIVLDNSVFPSEELFERAVSLTASLLVEISKRGYSYRLITCDKAFPFGNDGAHLW
ncbi:MAG: DUF58 domain-containing protein, partial [Nitrospirae bacterium]